MTINHEKKLIFIHIPKNAGTSIINTIGSGNVYIDRTIDQYKMFYWNWWKKYTKFTVVRDPVDRFISAYKFLRMKENEYFSPLKGMHRHHDLCNQMNINEYVEYLYNNIKEYDRWTYPQTFMIQNKHKEIEIDYFARYENLSEDLKKIGIDNIQKLNSSKIENKKLIKLTENSKSLLYKIYDIDYSNFGYKKT